MNVCVYSHHKPVLKFIQRKYKQYKQIGRDIRQTNKYSSPSDLPILRPGAKNQIIELTFSTSKYGKYCENVHLFFPDNSVTF
jgi:hypothetical protein